MVQVINFWWMCAVMWGLFVNYSRSAVEHVCVMWQACLFRANARNMLYMYISAPGYIIDCSDFNWCIYTSSLVSAYEVTGICGISMTFERHIYFWLIYDYSMANKSCRFFLLVCAVIWGLHLDYTNRAVGHTCVMWQAYLFRGICQ